MTQASLFSGIGGAEVAAEMMGWLNAFHCEINPFGRAVLDYWFPNSESYEDITKTDFTKWRGRIDVLTGGFPCQPFSYAGRRGGGQTITATSGRRCCELLTKSSRAGSLAKMLLVSPLWSKAGYSLIWDARPIYSEKWTEFTDTDCAKPSPSSASAEILRVADIPSSRCLFQLRLAERPTDATGSSSSPLMQTPTATQFKEDPEDMRARVERNGYRNGTKFNSLESRIFYDPKMAALLPTPTAVEVTHKKRTDALKAAGASMKSRVCGDNRPNGLMDYLNFHGILPTPRANKVTDLSLTPSLAARGKGNLEEEVAKMLLPTPTCNDAINQSLPPSQASRNDSLVKRVLTGEMGVSIPKGAGQTFRLSPLFTEEMMGFPSLWTTYPFLRESGAPKALRPTEMP